jgi:exosortase/archaeosortase family protein
VGSLRHRARRFEAALLAAAFLPLLVEWGGYVGRVSRLSYACLVPVLAGVLLVRELRGAAHFERSAPGALGTLLLAAAALVLAAGTLGGVFTLSLAAFPLGVAGFFARWCTPAGLARLAWPLVLLAAMVPPPMPLIDAVNPALVRASGATAVLLLAPLDPASDWQGSMLTYREWTLRVSEACSGSGTFLTLLVFGLFLAGLFRMRLAPALCLLALSGPLTLLVNGLRIATSAVLIDRFGPEAGGGLPHELLGQVLFLASAVLLATLVARLSAPRESVAR